MKNGNEEPKNVLLFQSESTWKKKLPEASLKSAAVRKAVIHHLVRPVFSVKRNFLAFRLVWSKKRYANVHYIWRNICSYQADINSALKGIDGVEFFISTITATFSLPSKDVSPALAFWVALNSEMVEDLAIYNVMRNNSLGAELRLLNSRKEAKDGKPEADREGYLVGMVLKDHQPGYVSDMLKQILPAEEMPSHREHLYIKSKPGSDYEHVLLKAGQSLERFWLKFYTEVY